MSFDGALRVAWQTVVLPCAVLLLAGCGSSSTVEPSAAAADPEIVAACADVCNRCDEGFWGRGSGGIRCEESCECFVRPLRPDAARDYFDCMASCNEHSDACLGDVRSQAVTELAADFAMRVSECNLDPEYGNATGNSVLDLFTDEAVADLAACLDESCADVTGCLAARATASLSCTSGSDESAVTGQWCIFVATAPELCQGDGVGFLALEQNGDQVTGTVCEDYDEKCHPIEGGRLTGGRLTFSFSGMDPGGPFRVDVDLSAREEDGVLFGVGRSEKCACSMPLGYHKLAD